MERDERKISRGRLNHALEDVRPRPAVRRILAEQGTIVPYRIPGCHHEFSFPVHVPARRPTDLDVPPTTLQGDNVGSGRPDQRVQQRIVAAMSLGVAGQHADRTAVRRSEPRPRDAQAHDRAHHDGRADPQRPDQAPPQSGCQRRQDQERQAVDPPRAVEHQGGKPPPVPADAQHHPHRHDGACVDPDERAYAGAHAAPNAVTPVLLVHLDAGTHDLTYYRGTAVRPTRPIASQSTADRSVWASWINSTVTCCPW
jgi:hypothetical protein